MIHQLTCIALSLSVVACTGRAVESIGQCELDNGRFQMEEVAFNCRDLLDDVDIIPLDIERSVRDGPCPRQKTWMEQQQILVDKDHMESCEITFSVTYNQISAARTEGTFVFMLTCESTWCSGTYRWSIDHPLAMLRVSKLLYPFPVEILLAERPGLYPRQRSGS